MTDAELNLEAATRGWKTAATKSSFRDGYTAACNGRDRDDHRLTVKREISAWQAGFDLLAEQQLQPGEHVIRIAEKDRTVILNRAEGGEGWEVTVPIAGGTSVVYGDTAVIAMEEARKRLTEAVAEFAQDEVESEYVIDVEVAGATHIVTQKDYKSGRFTLQSSAFSDIFYRGSAKDDQEKALDVMRDRIAERLGMIAEARTVNGVRADVVIDEQRLDLDVPGRSPEDWLCVIAELQAQADAADRALRPYKRALKAAEEKLEEAVRKAAEAGALIREPSLPLGAAS